MRKQKPYRPLRRFRLVRYLGQFDRCVVGDGDIEDFAELQAGELLFKREQPDGSSSYAFFLVRCLG